MTHDDQHRRQPVLSPVDRYSEIIFGLIMALSFTCSLSVAQAGQAEVRTMLLAALGCNTAWGIVDGLMYLLDNLTERGRGLALMRRLRAASGPEAADETVRTALPSVLAEVLQPGDVDVIRTRLTTTTGLDGRLRLTLDDFRGAVGVSLLVIASTLPVSVPFLFIDDPALALRVSNGVAVAMLFLIGWQQGRYAGVRPLTMAGAMVAIGVVCVGLTVALGG